MDTDEHRSERMDTMSNGRLRGGLPSLIYLCSSVFICGSFFSPVAGAEEKTLEVGFAEADITPKVGRGGKPVYLAGFGRKRPATGVHDRLFARAVVLRDGKAKVGVVSADLVGLFLDSAER